MLENICFQNCPLKKNGEKTLYLEIQHTYLKKAKTNHKHFTYLFISFRLEFWEIFKRNWANLQRSSDKTYIFVLVDCLLLEETQMNS